MAVHPHRGPHKLRLHRAGLVMEFNEFVEWVIMQVEFNADYAENLDLKYATIDHHSLTVGKCLVFNFKNGDKFTVSITQ